MECRVPDHNMNSACNAKTPSSLTRSRPGLRPPASTTTQQKPEGAKGPFQAGGQAPPFHRVTKPPEGEFNGITVIAEIYHCSGVSTHR